MNLVNILNTNGVKIIKKEETSQSENVADTNIKESVENVQVSDSTKEEVKVTDGSLKSKENQ